MPKSHINKQQIVALVFATTQNLPYFANHRVNNDIKRLEI